MKKTGSPPTGPPRGMRDFYPEDMAVRMHLFDAWRTASERFGFAAYDAPVVENLDLLKRKSGEEIVHQIYAFQDKNGRDLALRPEMTPTLARMVAARLGSLSLPLKWYTIAQCFRYERMTRGRKREHYQWNLDIIGEPSVSAEVEVIATAIEALRQLGLGPQHFRVRYSSRALLGELLENRGIRSEHHAATFLALDKRGKIGNEQVAELLGEAGLDAEAGAAVLEITQIQSLEEALDGLDVESPVVRAVRQFNDLITAYGLADYLCFDISVIRGLAYYTGIVFEAFDTAGKFRAIFGGGRYDNLLSDIGGKPATGVGLGFGDVVVGELLSDLALTAATQRAGVIAIGYMEEGQHRAAVQAACRLRADGHDVDLSLTPEKARQFFSRAGKQGYAEAVYIGPDDIEQGVLRVKNLDTREERQMEL